MLKRSHPPLDTFSMSSMTDVIFLLLIFFMVTSTFVFPSAIDVNLPQSAEQTSLKPQTEVYIDKDSNIFLVADRNDSTPEASTARAVTREELLASLMLIQKQDSTRAVALYADSTIRYARVIEILDLAARNNLRLVLATKGMKKE
ncbi:MAG: biopolymer transporter ExbD [Muribaculaceae bacterium]|nr:biopolymer transporter ExbD [Muribaculaceae bacterium]